jgi:hypothetical protein
MSNNNEDILKFLGICVVVGVLVFYGVKFLKLQAQVLEGATTMSNSGTTTTTTNGVGGGASQYNTALKAQVTNMQDTLLIPKYRSEYENVLLNLEDFINLSMLRASLNIITEDTQEARRTNQVLYSSLKTMSDAKGSLNSIMKYLDSH